MKLQRKLNDRPEPSPQEELYEPPPQVQSRRPWNHAKLTRFLGLLEKRLQKKKTTLERFEKTVDQAILRAKVEADTGIGFDDYSFAIPHTEFELSDPELASWSPQMVIAWLLWGDHHRMLRHFPPSHNGARVWHEKSPARTPTFVRPVKPYTLETLGPTNLTEFYVDFDGKRRSLSSFFYRKGDLRLYALLSKMDSFCSGYSHLHKDIRAIEPWHWRRLHLADHEGGVVLMDGDRVAYSEIEFDAISVIALDRSQFSEDFEEKEQSLPEKNSTDLPAAAEEHLAKLCLESDDRVNTIRDKLMIHMYKFEHPGEDPNMISMTLRKDRFFNIFEKYDKGGHYFIDKKFRYHDSTSGAFEKDIRRLCKLFRIYT